MARSFTDNGSSTTSYVGRSVGVATGFPVSIACWVNATTFVGFPAIIQIDDGTNTNYIGLAITGSGAVFAQCHSAGGGVWAQTVTVATTNTWTHIAGVFASSTSRVAYINGGNKVTDATSNTPAALNRTTIGGDRVISDGLNGSIAWVGIWNIAISDQDVANLGQSIHPYNVHREALVACPDMIGVSPEPDRIGGVTWAVGGTGTTAYSNSPRIYFPRNSWKSAPISFNRTFGGSVTAKVNSATAPLTISRPFVGTVTAKASNTGALRVSRPYGGSAQAKVSASGSFTRGILPPPTQNQTLKISSAGSFTVVKPRPTLIPVSTGYYVFLDIEGSYRADFLTGGIDYSQTIQTIISGPYPDSGTAQQALWTFLNLPFPFANPLPPPPPGMWTNR